MLFLVINPLSATVTPGWQFLNAKTLPEMLKDEEVKLIQNDRLVFWLSKMLKCGTLSPIEPKWSELWWAYFLWNQNFCSEKVKKNFEKFKNFELIFLSSYGRYRHVFDFFGKPQP